MKFESWHESASSTPKSELRSRRSNICNQRRRWRYLLERQRETETSGRPGRPRGLPRPQGLPLQWNQHPFLLASAESTKVQRVEPKTEAPCAISPWWRTPRRSQGCPAHTRGRGGPQGVPMRRGRRGLKVTFNTTLSELTIQDSSVISATMLQNSHAY